jgi:hypothetical protein
LCKGPQFDLRGFGYSLNTPPRYGGTIACDGEEDNALKCWAQEERNPRKFDDGEKPYAVEKVAQSNFEEEGSVGQNGVTSAKHSE